MTEQPRQCGRCQHELPPDAAFCPECGAAIAARCAQCGTENAPGHKFCEKCGQALAPAPAHERDPRFTSPQSYTPSTWPTRSSPPRARSRASASRSPCSSATSPTRRRSPSASARSRCTTSSTSSSSWRSARCTATRAPSTSSSATGSWRSSARRSLTRTTPAAPSLAALGIRAAPARLAGREGRPGDEAPSGCAWGSIPGSSSSVGSATTCEMDYTAVGDTTNLAARLEQLAEPGAILISETTAPAGPGHRPRRAPRTRSTSRARVSPCSRTRLVGPGPRRSPLEERPAGRSASSSDASARSGCSKTLFAQVVAGQGQVVGVVGEPGMGKSRLLHEFRRPAGGANGSRSSRDGASRTAARSRTCRGSTSSGATAGSPRATARPRWPTRSRWPCARSA